MRKRDTDILITDILISGEGKFNWLYCPCS